MIMMLWQDTACVSASILYGKGALISRGATCISFGFIQVLMATAAALMRRTPSVMQPQLFTFEDHFDFEAVIGRSPHSEVYRARHKISGELFAVKRSMRRFRSRADRERCAHALTVLHSVTSFYTGFPWLQGWAYTLADTSSCFLGAPQLF